MASPKKGSPGYKQALKKIKEWKQEKQREWTRKAATEVLFFLGADLSYTTGVSDIILRHYEGRKTFGRKQV